MRWWLTVLAVVICAPGWAAGQEVADSGIVRFRVDLDSVVVSLDGGAPILHDTYGNRLVPDSWFMLSVSAGLHVLSLGREGYGTIERSIAVNRDEVTTLEVSFVTEAATAPVYGPAVDAAELAQLFVVSDPPRATLRVEGRDEEFTTPTQLVLLRGEHVLTAYQQGYDTLVFVQELLPRQSASLVFILKQEQPPPISAMDMGLEYQAILPLKREESADHLRNHFTALAETFAIVPLAQGILARLVMGETNRREANALIIAGVGLTGGSYLLGKVLSADRRARVRTRNQEITEENARAQQHNKDVDRLVRERNAEIVLQWRIVNRMRGRVDVTSR
jgi:hypothetical protein